MSIRIMTAVWELVDITASETLLLISLADQANDDGVCWPSVGTIQRRTKLSERTVQGLLSKLRKKGYVSWTERSGHSNIYQLPISLIHNPRNSRPPQPLRGGQPLPPPPQPLPPRPPQPLHPESNAVESIKNLRAREGSEPTIVQEGLRALKDVLKNSKPRKSKTKG